METDAKSGLLAWWHRTPLYRRILGAMVLGVVAGLLLGAHAKPLEIPSKLVLRLLGALAPALILFAIIQALMAAKFEKGTAGRLIRLLILNTLVAISVGLLVANVIKPGHWAKLSPAPAAGAAHAEGKPDMLQMFLENIPRSVLGPLTDNGKVIGVIFLAVAFGIALRKHAPAQTSRSRPRSFSVRAASWRSRSERSITGSRLEVWLQASRSAFRLSG